MIKNPRCACNDMFELRYSEKWDAYYCVRCDKWLEGACPAKEGDGQDICPFECWKRPEKPSEEYGKKKS